MRSERRTLATDVTRALGAHGGFPSDRRGLGPARGPYPRGVRHARHASTVVPAQAPRLPRILATAAGKGVTLPVIDTGPRA